MLKYIKIILWILAIFGLLSIVLLIFGFRPIIVTGAIPDWGATGVVVNIIIPIAMLPLGILIQNKFISGTDNSRLIEQSLNYEKRYEEYQLTSKYFNNALDCGDITLSSIQKSVDDELNEKNNLRLIRIKHLYSDRVYKLAFELVNILMCIKPLLEDMDVVYNHLVEKNCAEGDFQDVVDDFFNVDSQKYDESSFESVCKYCKLYNFVIEDKEPKDYDYYEMYKDKEERVYTYKAELYELLELMKKEMIIKES